MRPALLVILMLSLPAAAAAATTPADGVIAAAQRQLRQAGYDAGPANGVMTAKTARALLAYQRANAAPASLSPELQAAKDAVAAAQRGLASLGLLKAPPDGAIGPLTRDAIIRFEVARKLPVDPRVSDRLLAALAPSGAAVAPPPAAAPPAAPGAAGRQPLPPGVTPPPIR